MTVLNTVDMCWYQWYRQCFTAPHVTSNSVCSTQVAPPQGAGEVDISEGSYTRRLRAHLSDCRQKVALLWLETLPCPGMCAHGCGGVSVDCISDSQ